MTDLGIPIDPAPAHRPQPVVLSGRLVTLLPFDLPAQAEALYLGTHGPEKEDLWRYMSEGPFAGQDEFRAAFAEKQRSVDPFFFAIVENATGVPVGQASYLRIEPAHRVIEIGNIIFTPANIAVERSAEWTNLSPRFVVDYHWTPDVMTYASRSEVALEIWS